MAEPVPDLTAPLDDAFLAECDQLFDEAHQYRVANIHHIAGRLADANERLVAGYREAVAERDLLAEAVWAAAGEPAVDELNDEIDSLSRTLVERDDRLDAIEAALRDERALSANYEGALRLILDHEVAGYSADLAGEALSRGERRRRERRVVKR